MNAIRVLRLYHSGVVGEYRERDRLLRSAHGYDLHLVVPPAWEEGGLDVQATDDRAVPTHIVPTRGRRHPILFWYALVPLLRIIRKVRPHIIDIHEEPYSLATAGVLLAARAAAPQARVCIYTAQNILKHYPPPFRQFEQRALKRAAAAYPCSSEAGEVLRAKGFSSSLYVLPLGVALRPPAGPRRRDTLYVGFLGRFESYKGGDIALRAFAEASAGLDSRLEMVGSGSLRAGLEERARELGVASRVTFTGAVSQDEALARVGGYDIVIVPSLTTAAWKEQFGRVPAQAMAAGVAVLASDSGSLPELLNGCGEFAREGDVADFARKLRRLMLDPTARGSLGALGRQRAERALSWDRVAEGHAAMYRDVLSGHP